MTEHDAITAGAADTPSAATGAGIVGNMGRHLLARVSAWIATGAEYCAAAALYEDLARLSDAELHRRGLTRESLARDVCAAADRSSRR